MTRPARRGSPQAARSIIASKDALTVAETSALQTALLRWFAGARRTLPWRAQRDPYSTWVSEIMLQQTQVATVVPYFERWMRTYPTVSALARSREQDVLKLWEGLGYYSRARSLLAGARVMCEKFAGQVPSDLADLQSIPGIGRYTAGAIASIAYQEPAAILDGNVMRVLCRLRDLEGDPRKGSLNELLWKLAQQLVTDTRPAELNESLMELGATICTPTRPKCPECPVQRQCKALATGTVELRPSPMQRAAPTEHCVMIAVISRGGRILVQQQTADAPRWAGLWTFPDWQCANLDQPQAAVERWLTRELGLGAAKPRATRTAAPHAKHTAESPPITSSILLRGKYTITRFRFSFVAVHSLVPRGAQVHTKLPAGYSWVTRQQLLHLPMPAPHRRIALALP